MIYLAYFVNISGERKSSTRLSKEKKRVDFENVYFVSPFVVGFEPHL